LLFGEIEYGIQIIFERDLDVLYECQKAAFLYGSLPGHLDFWPSPFMLISLISYKIFSQSVPFFFHDKIDVNQIPYEEKEEIFRPNIEEADKAIGNINITVICRCK
jgi:hypothetical protein